jgi:hypothetical protein
MFPHTVPHTVRRALANCDEGWRWRRDPNWDRPGLLRTDGAGRSVDFLGRAGRELKPVMQRSERQRTLAMQIASFFY